jgi:putative ABC transport system permease protein
MNTLWQDLRYGARMLLKRPGFTLVAILTLSLGIGANTAIFSVINSVLLRPLPYPQPERIAHLWETNRKQNVLTGTVSPLCFTDWRGQSQSFEAMSAYRFASLALTGGAEPERLTGVAASAGFFEVLGVTPLLGRGFTAEEDKPGNNRVVVLGHGLWQRRFASDEKLIGQTITLDGQSHTVIGVMPPKFRYPNAAELWTPLALDLSRSRRGSHFLFAIGRLKTGITPVAAQAELDVIARNLEKQYPDNNRDQGINLVPLHEQLVGQDLRLRLWVLLAAVGLVLLIACVNVANLQLARAATRYRETAIRSALGAGRGRLVRQFLTESLLLAVLGGLSGLLLAKWGADWLANIARAQFPQLPEISLDTRVLGFTLLVSLLTGVIFGLAPALQSVKINVQEALKESGPGATGQRQRVRSLLVIAEVALAVVLLVGAGLLINSFFRLQRVNLGFDPENLLTFNIALPQTRYGAAHLQAAFFQQTLQRIAALPEVQVAGAVSDLPFSGSRSGSSFSIDGRAKQSNEDWNADIRLISPDYFRALGIQLHAGRAFSERDVKETPGVVIINQTMARRFWPNEDPLGKRLTIGTPQETELYGRAPSREIVGIVGDLKHQRLADASAPEMYVPYQQLPGLAMSLAVRGRGDAAKLTGAVREAVRAVDRDQPISRVALMAERLARAVATERLNALLLTAFAAVALLLAGVGIYGVMAYTVTQGTREIGIRLALGAQARDVLRLIVGQGLLLTGIGLGLGLVTSFALTRLLERLLFGITATDPLVFSAATLLLSLIALLACYIPARRATKVDPLVALKYE